MSGPVIRTPDQRLRIFISSTLGELAAERAAARSAIERLRLVPVMFEDGARPHPPRSLYRAYLDQSHVFVGIYWQRYGWVAEGEAISGLEDEYRLAGDRPRLIYIKEPAPEREERLKTLIGQFQRDDLSSYRRFRSLEEFADLLGRDLALLLTERFEAAGAPRPAEQPRSPPPPVPLTRTFGREHELQRICRYLSGDTRLLTLTGPGGVGKTRLALVAAGALRDRFPGAIHFVPLQTITSRDMVGRCIVDRLAIRTEGAWTPEAALAYQLRDRPTLLILDNLEQIEGIEQAVRGLLEQMPRLTILATSRRALRIEGEQELAVPPLRLPPRGKGAEAENVEAVQLFLDRARAINPTLPLDREEREAIVEICRRVDGLPLAIELAAARTRLMPPGSVLKRLDAGFEVLASRVGGRPERHQTLRATLEWSRNLLGEDARRLMARLAVFVGSFSLEAAESICDVDGSGLVVEPLTELLDSSLVLPAEDAHAPEPRFRMLQTVRAYAGELLEAAGEAELMARRHIDWYAQLSASAAPYLCGPHQRDWAARFDAERMNVRAAVKGALASELWAIAVQIAWDTTVYYEIRDATEEPRGWIRQVSANNPELDPILKAKLSVLATRYHSLQGDFPNDAEALESAAAAFLARECWFEAAVAKMDRADLQLRLRNDPEGARTLLAEAAGLFAKVGHDWGVARCEIMMGLLVWGRGDLQGASRHLHNALDRARHIDNEPQIARALSLLSMLQAAGAEAAPPEALLADAARIVVRGRYRTEAAACLEAFAAASFRRGELPKADVALKLSRHLRRELQVPAPAPVASLLEDVAKKGEGLAPVNDPDPDASFDFLAAALLDRGHRQEETVSA